MTREQRRDIFEAIGLIAIVASLIFLALEVRQANVASRIAARDSVAQGHMDFLNAAIDPSIVAAAWPKSHSNEELTRLEVSQIDHFHGRRWRHYERIFHLYQYGVLSEDEWTGYKDAIGRAKDGTSKFWDISRENWRRDKSGYSRSFQEFVDAELSIVE
jgi:hypothetical protein